MEVIFDELFKEFFKTATGLEQPYEYQRKLARRDTLPALLDIPTGVGKTAAAILAWTWRRRFADQATRKRTPRRLVYCLPMRVLVEQTHECVIRWLDALGMLAGEVQWQGTGLNKRLERYCPEPGMESPVSGWAEKHAPGGKRIAVHLLMGGEERTDWALYPERDAVLIGTQDMLLSRALNRGYAASRARWPMEFGLLHNDCLWVFDEVQLMGSGLATTAQFDAFHHGGKQSAGMGFYGTSKCLWMSATIQPDWLETVDHARPDKPPFQLSESEWQNRDSDLGRRLHAVKSLRKASSGFEKKPAALAREVFEAHQRANENEDSRNGPAMTLVVVNTVKRAMELSDEIGKLTKKAKFTAEPLLIYSRFRPPDRKTLIDKLLSPRPAEGRIVVSTQVVEAGVDISAKVLFTELAPWPSLVQRFGRCNRKGEYAEATDSGIGEHSGAVVSWIDVEEKAAAPYEWQDLQAAKVQLEQIMAAKIPNVGPIALPNIPQAFKCRYVLRRKDAVDLFDTTPDLAGNDIDVSRYIRDTEDHDVQVFWREVPKDEAPNDKTPAAHRLELCSVPLGDFRDFVFVKKNRRVWRWDFLDGKWTNAQNAQVYPGQAFLIACDAGGYSPKTGWHGDVRKDPVVEPVPLPSSEPPPDKTDSDQSNQMRGVWRSIQEHTDEACRELESVLAELVDGLPRDALRTAMRWHDRGKAHDVFQNAVADGKSDGQGGTPARPTGWQGNRCVAKAPQGATLGDRGFWQRYERRHFRHELASALAVLQAAPEKIPDALRDLVAYLVAAHHGKVRLSIRSLPEEERPNGDRRFARGVWDGDLLPQTDLGGGIEAPEVVLTLEPMVLGLSEDGHPSWAERVLDLRDSKELGPFRLAYLEALLRAADWRASANADLCKEKTDG
ncbi:MAG: type I-G CRISPR-associated helicase/endonuclease Cas3g [Pirellulales bacterium]